jgi:hypothetical protein
MDRRTRAAAAIAAIAALAASAHPAAAADDGHVLVVGDSRGVGSQPYLRFPAATD